MGNLQRECLSLAYELSGLQKLTVLTACLPLPLHLEMVESSTSLPVRQPRLGVPEVRTLKEMMPLRREATRKIKDQFGHLSPEHYQRTDGTGVRIKHLWELSVHFCVAALIPRSMSCSGHGERREI